VTPPAPNKRFDLVALGEAMLEFNQTRPGEPNFLQGFGGDTSNAVIAAARAGARTAYLTRIGDDWFGQQLLALWRSEGVDLTGVEADPARPTGIYLVSHGPRGHEFSYLRAGSAASAMTPAWLPAHLVHQSRILHVSGISLAISASAEATVLNAMREARAAHTTVSFDTNLRLKLWPLAYARGVIEQALKLTDICLPSLEDMQILTGLSDPDAIVDWCHDHGAPIVVLKLGAAGCIASDRGHRFSEPPRQVRVVDATGAGDCFCGNLLARLAQGAHLADAVRFANAAASLAVQGFGAVNPLPRQDVVRSMLDAAPAV
jgi:2-dehydro-3-deoxygluconokinase